ncbi:MAG: D-tagatose-bisphosphate aldolase, class II, non-catalytic subunit [Planctomycetes bacterium]|nr:D-tagatose-bisphosphate aldolase, class II, non-catalytic subunit [Planctomycetota bacterium]
MCARDSFIQLLKDNRAGKGTGIYSICSAHATVLEACMEQATADGSMLLIESTSNQVDQFGGYTGMKPADFVAYVKKIADKCNFPMDKVLLGGDHLGPNAWQNESAEVAMKHSRDLIAEYVKAGYQKIHLDASMHCADDLGDRHTPLADEIVASRAAELCQVAELTWKEFCSDRPAPVYIIGTEVPIPGGAQEEEDEVKPTSVSDSQRTIRITHQSFLDLGLEEAWTRVLGLVVQPGVEFGDDQVFDYDRSKAVELSQAIEGIDGLVYEAHSTDYQSEKALTEMVKDHFCILKVGPWVTFAYREALFALEAMEKELISEESQRSNLLQTMEQVMTKNPKYWQKYYPENPEFKRKYSFSDRSRYYWPDKEIEIAKEKLISNLEKNPIPLSLLSQYLPGQYHSVREKGLEICPLTLIKDHIRDVIGMYSRACNLKAS